MCKTQEPYLVIRNDLYSDIYSDLDLDIDLDDKSYIYIKLYEDEAPFGRKKCDECINEDIKYEKLISDIYEMYVHETCQFEQDIVLKRKSLQKKLKNFFKMKLLKKVSN